jgi:hypothetical protein
MKNLVVFLLIFLPFLGISQSVNSPSASSYSQNTSNQLVS